MHIFLLRLKEFNLRETIDIWKIPKTAEKITKTGCSGFSGKDAKLANVILRGLCDGKNKCQLYSSNDVYKDPCPGVRKYLEVNYRCEKSCLCMASGDPHYKTYDGSIIHFMGICKYTMTKSKDSNDECAFNVEVKNERRGGNTRVSFTKSVDVTMYDKTVRILPQRKVLISGRRRHLPIKENEGKLKVFQSGRFVQVWSACGVKVKFDGHHAVSVIVPGKYRNAMEGLCGNCNGDRNDDFRTKEGKDVKKDKNRYSLVGDSFAVMDEDDETGKCITQESPPVTCDNKMSKLVSTNAYCGLIIDKKGAFKDCIRQFPDLAKQFFESCKFDICSIDKEAKLLSSEKCDSVEAFAEECEENGVSVKWRTSSFCPMKCEDPNMEYLSAGFACPATCLEPKPTSCDLEPTEGCFCKKGFVMSDGKCVRQTECGCTDKNGEYYPIGARKDSGDCTSSYTCKQTKKGQKARFVKTASTRKCVKFASCRLNGDGERACVCNKGYTGDGYKKCERPESCLCMASGDPHYKTYDGSIIHFMGICKYTMTKSKDSNDECAFNVEVKNEHRGGNTRVSFTKSVDVTIYGKTVRILPQRKVLISGRRRHLPIKENDGKLKVFQSGRFVQVWSSCGVKVKFDGHHAVSVIVPGKYRNAMEGLCGNCNGDKNDDFRTKEGKDVKKDKNRYSLVGDSFAVIDQDDETGKCITQESPPVTCDNKMSKLVATNAYCGLIIDKKGAFKDCIRQFPDLAKQFFESCKFDICSIDKEERLLSTEKCDSVEAFAEECEENGVSVKWRTSSFCRK
ncbi:hypothetical protein FSP39_022729 [Pinctada imbricata]|uniref:Zonadhesin n=1 Tax=Pinctada imbricata TaxID=66713 RepID=A0AA89BXE9_PINIB|nr:hypothetical protein FSP39_022729 [Pinctada imbricata]